LAIVHLAMYDAFVGAAQSGLSHYLTPKPAAGSSEDAAVAAATHATLSHLFPSQKPFFDLKHAQAGLSGADLQEGHQFGL
jgi:vanadium chloroperoxidase